LRFSIFHNQTAVYTADINNYQQDGSGSGDLNLEMMIAHLYFYLLLSLEKSHLKNKLWLIAGLWALAFGSAFFRYDGFSYRNDYAI
jgi:hypothetical protein